MRQRGFTLVELLVVIAIIGALASIVLGALSNARAKAQDTKIKSNLGNMRSQAALYFTDHGSYGPAVTNNCDNGMFTDSIMVNAVASMEEANGGNDASCYTSDSTGGANTNTWSVSVPLRSNITVSWCADSNGYAGQKVATVVSGSAVCQ